MTITWEEIHSYMFRCPRRMPKSINKQLMNIEIAAQMMYNAAIDSLNKGTDMKESIESTISSTEMLVYFRYTRHSKFLVRRAAEKIISTLEGTEPISDKICVSNSGVVPAIKAISRNKEKLFTIVPYVVFTGEAQSEFRYAQMVSTVYAINKQGYSPSVAYFMYPLSTIDIKLSCEYVDLEALKYIIHKGFTWPRPGRWCYSCTRECIFQEVMLHEQHTKSSFPNNR